MPTIELLTSRRRQGRRTTDEFTIPDDATRARIEIDRPPANRPLPEQANAPGRSPMHYMLQLSLDGGSTWNNLVGGNIKGGNWVGARGLETKTWAEIKPLPEGTNRRVRVRYHCRRRMPVNFRLIVDGNL